MSLPVVTPPATAPTTPPVPQQGFSADKPDLFSSLKISADGTTSPQHDLPTKHSLALTHRLNGLATPAISRPQTPYTQSPRVDFDGLSWPSVGTRARLEATPEEAEARIVKLSGAIRTLLECIGEDPDREGLLDTPRRYAKAMLYFTKGYEENLKTIINNAVFEEDHDEMGKFVLCVHESQTGVKTPG
jgi:GTP cyclohydrolase I